MHVSRPLHILRVRVDPASLAKTLVMIYQSEDAVLRPDVITISLQADQCSGRARI